MKKQVHFEKLILCSKNEILKVSVSVTGIFLFLIIFSSCGKESSENTGCGDEVTDNTNRVVVTKADLLAGYSAFFKTGFTLSPSGEEVTLWFDRKTTTNICTSGQDGDIWSEASAWVYEPQQIEGLSVFGSIVFSTSQIFQYTFMRTGAGVNTFHYLGNIGWTEINDYSGEFIQVLNVNFPNKGSTEANINYAVDSLKLEVLFRNKYCKPK